MFIVHVVHLSTDRIDCLLCFNLTELLYLYHFFDNRMFLSCTKEKKTLRKKTPDFPVFVSPPVCYLIDTKSMPQ